MPAFWANTLWLNNGWAYFSAAMTQDFSGVAPTWSSDKIMTYTFYQSGGITVEPQLVITFATGTSITTNDAQADTGDRLRLSGVVNSSLDTSLHCYFDYGFNSLVSETLDCGTVTGTGANGTFKTWIHNPDKYATYYFRARAVGTTSGTVYGTTKTFDWSSSGLTQIVTLPATDIKYTSAYVGVNVGDLGTETSLAISIDYGLTDTLGTNVVVDATCTAPNEYLVELTSLAEATQYYYQAKAYDGGSDYYRGEILSFQTKNSHQPGPVQEISAWFGIHGWAGSGVWWLIALILCVIVAVVLRKKMTLAMIICALIIGCGIVLSVLDVWLIVVLAVATAGIGAWFFARKFSAGGG
jgi:hypothetical protein